MTKSNNSKAKWIWLSVLILLVCVAATAIAFISRLDSFFLDDEGAISLMTGDALGAGADKTDDASASTTEQGSAGNGGTTGTEESDPEETTAATEPPKNPGFEASDDNTVWSTNTQVEIFRVSYVNGEQVITVNSGSGDKVIAPGTENSYTFKLKNTGNVALNYTVDVDAYFSPADVEIPITGRINRYDGKWVAGDQEAYAEVPVLDAAVDHGTLGAGKYTYYTLDWLWPFESGNDDLDTMLGDLAVQQDLVFTIVIKTFATESDDPNDNSGIMPPQTGDNTNLALLIMLVVGSFAMMVFLLCCLGREKRRSNTEADRN